MKSKKFLLLIAVIIVICGLWLARGYWKQTTDQERGGSSVVWEQQDDALLIAGSDVEEVQEATGTVQTEESIPTDSEAAAEVKASSEAEEATEIMPETESEQKSESTPGTESEQKPESTSGTESEQEPENTPGTESTQESETAAGTEAGSENENLPEEPKLELVQQGYYDTHIIPDKFNAGCSNVENMLKINSAVTVDGIEYALGDNGGTVVLDLYYRNKTIPDEIVIKNVDFSEKKFSVRHGSMIDSKKKITFENCNFGFVAMEIDQDNVTYFFNNCSFSNFYGSNSTFVKCEFGGTIHDGMNPFKNIHVVDSYFSNFNDENTVGVHSDAIQIYGKEGIDAENITFRNCRIEIPVIEGGNSQINTCFMVQLEFSNGKNFLFENCIINGGGYSIYSWSNNEEFTLENVVFRNISIGRGRLYGEIYPNIGENVVFEGLKETDSLYVASVWKDNQGQVHLSVTNDTLQDRTMLVETSGGRKEYLIPSKQTVEQSKVAGFSDLPIDMEIILEDMNAEWVICYDKSGTEEKQIRFVNWGNEPVYR